MMKFIFRAVFLLLPSTFFAQTDANPSKSYIQVYGGWGLQGAVNTEQVGVAHKRGDFNEFDTDFDLHVKVNGSSDRANFYTVGLVMGQVWAKNERRFNPGFELDLSRTYSQHNSTLVNDANEEVHNINGDNEAEVIEFVEEHYGAGHHRFANTMNMESWNVAGNFTLTTQITQKSSIHAGFGFGFSNVLLNDAQCLQTSPAHSPPGYETTVDNGGGAVNHFNSQPNSSSMLIFGQARIGTKIEISNKIAFVADSRFFYRGEGDFIFGSTIYTDHAPTNHWKYSMGSGTGMMVNAGLMFSF
jgi:hypothetical protein